jgi:hypothetical protein
MTVRLSTGARTQLAGDLGFSKLFEKGVIHIYSGPQPLSADSPVTGTLLGVVTKDALPFVFGEPGNGLVFATASGGVASKAPADAWKFNGIAAGTAGYFRMMGNAVDSLGASTTLPRMDGTVGVSGADMNLTNTGVTIGAPNTIDVFQFTIPAQ